MTAEIPPRGLERDAEIAALLGLRPAPVHELARAVDRMLGRAPQSAGWLYDDETAFGSPSLDDTARERLTQAMAERGWLIAEITSDIPFVHCWRGDNPTSMIKQTGVDLCDAMSAAVLLALRSARTLPRPRPSLLDGPGGFPMLVGSGIAWLAWPENGMAFAIGVTIFAAGLALEIRYG